MVAAADPVLVPVAAVAVVVVVAVGGHSDVAAIDGAAPRPVAVVHGSWHSQSPSG